MSLFAPGLRLRDRYTLVERVGAGGMSEVWRATDDLLGRPVAVKALTAPLASDPELRQVIWREARAVAQLNHPHIAQVHDYGELPLPDGGGVAGYLVMEFVTGHTLADRLQQGPMPWPEATRTVGRVAAAVAAAHQRGLVHRDLKPGNVMLTGTGVKVLDFGIAAATGRTGTDPGRLVGTPTYAAPERLDPTVPAQPAADVYSLGVLLHEALTGGPPVSLPDWPAAARAHRNGSPAGHLPVAGLPEVVAQLCRSCLAVDPARRPRADQLATGLTEAAGYSGPAYPGPEYAGPEYADRRAADPGYARGTAAPVSRPAHAGAAPTRVERLPEPARRGNRLLVSGLGVAVVVLGLLAALLINDWRSGTGDAPGGTLAEPTRSASATPAGQVTPTGPTAPTGPAAPDEVIGAMDRVLLDAFDAGAVTPDGLEELREQVGKLREVLTKEEGEKRAKKLGEKAEDMREEVEELREEGEIDRSTAERLLELLDSLPDER